MQREAEHVALALLEHGQPRQRREQRRERRSRRAPRRAPRPRAARGRSARRGSRRRGLRARRRALAGAGHPAQLRRQSARNLPRSLTIALPAAGYIKTMNDFSRAPRVLVVEDDEDIAQALQRSLRMEGYEVRTAADGQAALEQGRAFAPDLVILDLGLPKLDGIEVARDAARATTTCRS